MGLHQTWRDIYCTYWKSHYHPSFDLQVLYISYFLLISQTSLGYLPMFLITTAMVFWLIAPVIFGPIPKMNLMQQDLRQFGAFINARVVCGAIRWHSYYWRCSLGGTNMVTLARVHDFILRVLVHDGHSQAN